MGGKPSSEGAQGVTAKLDKIASLQLDRINQCLFNEKKTNASRLYTTPVVASTLWSGKMCTIILVIRRPGCPFCREQAQSLCEALNILRNTIEFSSKLTPDSINMIAVCNKEASHMDDVQGFNKYFNADIIEDNNGEGSVYLDPTKGFYRALGYRRLSLFSVVSEQFRSAYRRLKGKGIESGEHGMESNPLMGGLLVVCDDGVLYQWEERQFGELLPVEEVVQAVEHTLMSRG